MGLNFGSGAARASCALERVNECQLCLIYFWIARSWSADAFSAEVFEKVKVGMAYNTIAVTEKNDFETLSFSDILTSLLGIFSVTLIYHVQIQCTSKNYDLCSLSISLPLFATDRFTPPLVD